MRSSSPFLPVPPPQGHDGRGILGFHRQEFARKFENEYHAIWDPKTNQCEYAAFYVEPIQGTGGYVVPPPNFFKGLKKVLRTITMRSRWAWRTGTLWSVENFGVKLTCWSSPRR